MPFDESMAFARFTGPHWGGIRPHPLSFMDLEVLSPIHHFETTPHDLFKACPRCTQA